MCVSDIPVFTPPATQVSCLPIVCVYPFIEHTTRVCLVYQFLHHQRRKFVACLSSGCPYVDRVIRSSMFVFTSSVVEPWFMCSQSAHALMSAVALVMRAVVLGACSALSVVEFCLACSGPSHALSRY